MSTSIYTPYFYIIQHVSSGMLYAGSRIKKNCHPAEFLKPNGYNTSSNVVYDLLLREGWHSFIVRRIRTFVTADQAYNYETRFLKRVDARNNDKFINMHNNDFCVSWGTEYHKQIMISLYGVDNYGKTKERLEKSRATCMRKYNVDSYTKTQECKDSIKNIMIEKYGVDNYTKTEEYIEKVKNTCLEKYGVEHHLKSPQIIEKRKITNIQKYGVDNVAQCPEIIEKIKRNRTPPKGESHQYFTGYYHTPEGIFCASTEHPTLDCGCIGRWCIKYENRVITKNMYSKSKYLQQRYSFEDLKDKTFKDIGFWFEKVK